MQLIEPLIKIIIVVAALITGAAVMVYLERKISAYIQNRIGPNRVGPGGWLQPIVDVVKLVMKEDIVPKSANRFVHDLAPILSISIALSTSAVIPFGNTIEMFGHQVKLMIADVNIGMLYILAMTSVGV